MTFDQAIQILTEAGVDLEDGLSLLNPYIFCFSDDRKVQLDGLFSLDLLEAVVVVMRNHHASNA